MQRLLRPRLVLSWLLQPRLVLRLLRPTWMLRPAASGPRAAGGRRTVRLVVAGRTGARPVQGSIGSGSRTAAGSTSLTAHPEHSLCARSATLQAARITGLSGAFALCGCAAHAACGTRMVGAGTTAKHRNGCFASRLEEARGRPKGRQAGATGCHGPADTRAGARALHAAGIRGGLRK